MSTAAFGPGRCLVGPLPRSTWPVQTFAGIRSSRGHQVWRRLGSALAHQWPSYAGYVVSFLTIGVMWVNHHHMFKPIERTTDGFLMTNVVFLMTIAFLPWPAALVAGYVRDPGGRSAATVVYGLTMTVRNHVQDGMALRLRTRSPTGAPAGSGEPDPHQTQLPDGGLSCTPRRP